MITYFKLAFRNVFRNRRRSIITFFAVTLGIFSYIVMEGVLDAFSSQSVENLKKIDTAHIKIFAEGYWDERAKEPLKHRIDNYKEIERRIMQMDNVQAVSPRITFGTNIYFSRTSLPIIGIAMGVTEEENPVFKLKDWIIKGEYFEEGRYSLVGRELAEDMKLDVGSWITIEFKDKNGIYDAEQLQVSGIFNTGHPDIDSSTLYVPLGLMQERLDMQNSVTEIATILDSEERIERSRDNIQQMLKQKFNPRQEFEVLTWKEQAESYIAFQDFKNMGGFVMIWILIIIIVIGIMNTMLMSVYERVREIGALMALGMKKSRVRLLFLLEGAIVGGFGAIIGMGLGLLFMYYLSESGFDIAAMYGEQDIGYIVKDIVYGSIRIGPFIQAFLIGVISAVIATYIPASNASKLNPADALRKY